MPFRYPTFRKFATNFILFISCLIIFFYLTVLLDRFIIGSLLFDRHKNKDLIFPSNSKVIYKSSEFEYTAKINSLGFRDYEYPVKKNQNRYRIVVIGDSFTYGWGVDIDEAWCKLVEKELRSEGQDIEVLNLGMPGASPRTYAEIAEKAVPLLKPDLVIVAILQGDDLVQTINEDIRMPANMAKKRSLINNLRLRLERCYPNLTRSLKRWQVNLKFKAIWKIFASYTLHSFTAEQKKRFENLDPIIKNMFISGKLNPQLIYLSVTQPDYFIKSNDIFKNEVRAGTLKMSEELKRIKKEADKFKSQVLVLSAPYRAYVCKEDLQYLRMLGFNIDDSFVDSNNAVYSIRDAADKAKLECYEFNKVFKENCGVKKLYYPFDGHFNAEGNKLFAKQVVNLLESKKDR